MMKLLFLGLLSMVASAVIAAAPTPKDCITIEAKGEFSLMTNKCAETVNLFWVYEGECASGCSQKFASKAYFYVSLLKEPYHLAACFAPQTVDPTWKGAGEPTCKE